MNEWDIYWINNRPPLELITKQNSHTALAEELKRLKQIYTGIHPACKIISGLQKELKESIVICRPHAIEGGISTLLG